MQHERDTPFLEHRPKRMEIGMRGRLRARHRIHQHRAASGVKRRFGLGAGAVTPRYRADRYQAAVSGAEVRDRAVERTRTAPQKFSVAAEKLRKCKGRENKLSIHSDQIERAAALGGVECAQREPSLRRHHILFEFDRRARVGGTRLGLRDKLDGFGSRSSQVERSNPLANAGVGVLREPFAQFHEVTIGVVESAALGVRHRCPFLGVSFLALQRPMLSSPRNSASSHLYDWSINQSLTGSERLSDRRILLAAATET